MDYVKKLYQQLDDEQKTLFSHAIHQIELNAYWETRNDLLEKFLRWLKSKRTKKEMREELEYMLSKEKPEQK